jgi:error-prone DNA polymerase
MVKKVEAKDETMAGVQLHVHSTFSFLDGASSPEALIQSAAAKGISSVALTDMHRISGMVPFIRAGQETGVKPVIGAEVELGDLGRLVLLSFDQTSYIALTQLLTKAHLDHARNQPRVDWDTLEQYGPHLIGLTGDRSGILAQAWFGGNRASLWSQLRRLQPMFLPGNLYLEITSDWLPGNRQFFGRLQELSEATGVPLVATAAAKYADKEDFPIFDLLTCIRLGQAVEDVHRERRMNAENYLKSWSEMQEALGSWPSALTNAVQLAERLNPPDLLNQRRAPAFAGLPSGVSALDYLVGLVREGARRRYGKLVSKVWPRIRHELEIIRDLDFVDYFLAVWDVAEFSRRSKIRFAGRGSAADSVVAYCLGITQVDAFHRGLLFERFMSRERSETPDIDIDFDARRRDEVEAYVVGRYGADRVARVATYQTYRQRMALREVGKALSFPPDELDRLAKSLPEKPITSILEEWEEIPELRQYENATALKRVLTWAHAVEGIPRHLGTHLGGVVISREPLTWVGPRELSAKGIQVIPFDKRDVEDLGLLKLDLLSLRTFTAVELATQKISEAHPEFAYDAIPLTDEKTYARLQAGEGVGVFQLESPAQRALAVRLQPDRWEDIVASLALIRPGPIKGNMVDPFVARRRGQEPVIYLHPLLEPILSKTYGVVLFQEQVIAIATALAGFSAGEADSLRRVMTHARSQSEMERIGEKFRERAIARGISSEVANQIFGQLVGYASYGFNEAHAAAFAETAYRTAYLLEHYPTQFFLGLLNAEPLGYYPVDVLLVEARHRGITILPMDVNRSDKAGSLADARSIRIGFQFLQGITEAEAASLVERRPSGGYRHPMDVVEGVEIRLDMVLRMIQIGAFDEVSPDRQQLLEETRIDNRLGLRLSSQRYGEQNLYHEILMDYRFVGFGQHAQWLSPWRSQLHRQGYMTIAEAKTLPSGKMVRIVGCLIRPHRPPTRSGRLVVFFSLLDETDLLEARLNERRYQQFGQCLFGTVDPVIEVVGRIENRGIDVHTIAPWSIKNSMQTSSKDR